MTVVWLNAWFVIPAATLAQENPPPYGQTYGGRGVDEGNYVLQTADKGYLITGSTTAADEGKRHLWLLKADPDGRLVWEQRFGAGPYQSGEALAQTLDGGTVILGTLLSRRPDDYDVRLLKTDSRGREIWSRIYGSAGWDWGASLDETADGGFIFTGWTDSQGAGSGDLWLVKTDSRGQQLWQRRYGGREHDRGYHVMQVGDGGYLVTGSTVSYAIGGADLWVLKLSAAGDIEWMRVLGGAGEDEGQFAQMVPSGGYIVLGSTTSYGKGQSDIWLIRLSATGTVLWSRTYGGPDREWANALAVTENGFTVVGTTLSSGAGKADIWLLRTDADGEEQWSRTYGGSGLDFGQSIHGTDDGGYILTGNTHSFGRGDSDIWLIRVDSRGKTLF